MEIKCYYNETNSMLFLYSAQTFDENNVDKITIDMSNHDVKNLHSFFQKRLLELLLKEEVEEVSFNSENIKNYDFYEQEPFQKLIDLINEIITETNSTIQKCFEKDENDNLGETVSD